MSPKISVIVPVYNVEKYLSRCVESIIHQTYEDLEIILVDDGSTDRSGELCDEYEKRDGRIRVIHKENGGISSARNIGLQYATGEYIGFVDSDDYIDPEMYMTLFDRIISESADIAICGISNSYAGNEFIKDNSEENLRVMDNLTALKMMLEGKSITASPCTKLFRVALLDGLAFSEDIHYGEDALFFTYVFLSVKRVIFTSKKLYCYYHRSGSVTTRPYSQKTYDIIKVYRLIGEQIKRSCPDLLDVANYRLIWAHFIVLDSLLSIEDYKNYPEYAEVVSFLKSNWLSVVRNKYLWKIRRVGAIFLKINVMLYFLFMRQMMAKEQLHA